MQGVTVSGKIIKKGSIREVESRNTGVKYRICDAVLADTSAATILPLWNEQIEQVHVGDNVTIENGYVTSFKGEIQLNIGKYGKLTVN